MALVRQFVEKTHYTEADYFEFEHTSLGRWEYVNGQIRLMAGGSDDHVMISSSIGRVLGNALVPRGCRVYVENIKVHTGDGINTFPDVSVICGERQYYLGRKDVVINPLLVVEVLSPSTAAYDQGAKLDHYQTINSLADYLLVDQSQARVTLHSRREGQWGTCVVTGLDSTVHLPSVAVDLALSDVYALIKFGE